MEDSLEKMHLLKVEIGKKMECARLNFTCLIFKYFISIFL